MIGPAIYDDPVTTLRFLLFVTGRNTVVTNIWVERLDVAQTGLCGPSGVWEHQQVYPLCTGTNSTVQRVV